MSRRTWQIRAFQGTATLQLINRCITVLLWLSCCAIADPRSVLSLNGTVAPNCTLFADAEELQAGIQGARADTARLCYSGNQYDSALRYPVAKLCSTCECRTARADEHLSPAASTPARGSVTAHAYYVHPCSHTDGHKPHASA